MHYDDIPTLKDWMADSYNFASVGGRVAAIRAALGTAAGPAAAAPSARSAELLAIDALIGDYPRALSPMSKINFLTQLERAIAAWIAANPNHHFPLSMAELKRCVDRKLALRNTASRYNRVTCIGFKIGCNYDKATNTIHPNWQQNTNYWRYSDTDRLDMQAKAHDLWNAIVAAHASLATIPIADDDRNLKIFMAPEFYFRGRNGAYSPDIVADIIPFMQTLGTKDGIYKDWLFVFGTAIAAVQTEETYCPTCNSTQNIRFVRNDHDFSRTTPKCTLHPAVLPITDTWGAEIHNVALIQHGALTHLVAKEYISHIDFRNSPHTGVPTIRKESDGNYLRAIPIQGSRDALHYNGPVGAIKNDERAGGCIFSIDGLTIGLEVCLDHERGGTVGSYGRAADYMGTIQILLIPSYGMSIGTGLHCKPNGICFGVDGMVRGSAEVKINNGAGGSENWWIVNAPMGELAVYNPINIPS
jgi:hypothetical protein